MTTSNSITLDHINAFFSLDQKLESLDTAPTATGGAGINNLEQFPPPKPSLPAWRKLGTGYAKKYLDQEISQQNMQRRQTVDVAGSTVSINTLDDVEETSTAAGDVPTELQDEVTRQIYATYFKEEVTYNSDLTITRYREEILQQLEINPVVIIQGPTGCGKTTQVPQYILDHCRSRGVHCNIIVTQPRKIAATSIARRVCEERNWRVGTLVGYQVAMDPCTCADTRLNYVTTGVLLEKLVNAKRMDMYTHVIIDEVHERNQETDFALLLVKKFLKTNSPRVKVILMSATFDSMAFSEYFSLYQKSGPAPVIEIIGKSKEVLEFHLYELKTLVQKMPVFDINNPTIDPVLYDTVCKLISYFDRVEKQEQDVPVSDPYAPVRGAVLIFLPGYEEISILNNKLEAHSFNKNFWIIPLHSSITVDEQAKVFKNPPPDHRKVILSTNIAESSITVPDIKYVIDFCLTKNLVTDVATNYTCLQLEWASKANCIQRRGRAGRVDIGKVYRMVPRQFYETFLEYGIPEIKRCPLTSVILHLKKLNLCEPQEMLAFAVDPPDLSDIGHAVLQLKEALALTARGRNFFDGDLTFIGRVMANLPLDIKLSKLIVFGYVFHCLEDCIIIASSLSLQSFFARPFQRALDAYRSKLNWDTGTFSDCLVYLYAYRRWRVLSQQNAFKKPGGSSENEWAAANYIQVRRIKEVDKLVGEIKSRLERLHIKTGVHRQDFAKDEKSILILKMVIAGAFFPYYYLQEPLDEKTVMRDVNENDPHTTVHISGLPSKHNIIYASSLKEMFACCSNNISIEFEESKAYIDFGANLNNPKSGVITPVYLAVKMRKLRMPLELNTFNEEEAERMSKQILSSKSRDQHKLISNRITVKPQLEFKKVILPSSDQTILKIFISHLNNCGSFWARDQQFDQLLNFLQMTINADRGKNLEPLTEEPIENMLCLALFNRDGNFYRALIRDCSENEVKVFFVDYGNEEVVNKSDLRKIDVLRTPDVLNTAALAMECCLAEIKPFRSSSGEWSVKANEWFKKVVNGVKLDARVYSVVQDKVRLTILSRDKHGINVNINQKMVELGFAEVAEENFASKQNHEVRMNSSSYTNANVVGHGTGSADVEVSWKEAAMCCSRLPHTGKKIKLHGPFNPLEVEYSGMTNVDRQKCFKVERDSINSVSFNAEPQDPYNAMLVAAAVGVGQSSNDLIGRNTTLMPKIQGLPTLVCLLFTPCAEIRTNKERNSYIGAICGLGYNPLTGDSIFPDHDIELTFDIEMSLEDIREVNAIRMGFNLLLHSQADILEYESAQARNVHYKTRSTILQLLQRPRQPKEPEYFKRLYQWNQVPVDLLLDAQVDESADHPDVLPLHKPPSLKKFPNTAMHRHLDELYTIAEMPTSSEFKLIRCELCSMDVTSTRDLLVHLDSEKHRRKEKKFKGE